MPRRITQLLIGLFLFGISMAMILRSRLGNLPWDVLHQGITEKVPISFGKVTVIVAALVLLLWIPLRTKPGLGTILNMLLIGPSVDFGLYLIGPQHNLGGRWVWLLGGIALNAVATAAYIGANFGPGPRDGLMTGIAARTGKSIRLVRTAIEVVVVFVGWTLAGKFGIGTIIFALTIGPLVHWLLPIFQTVKPRTGESAAGE